MVSHRDYSQELGTAYADRGFSIANPQPGLVDTRMTQLLPRVKLGDVGYIHRNQGNFFRLFNIHKVPGEEGQPRLERLPDGFTRLEPELNNQRNITEDTTQLFKTESVTIQGGKGSVQGPAVLSALTMGGSIDFKSTKTAGAVLVVPGSRPITCIDANRRDIKRYMEYATQHMASWISFFEAENLEPTDIFLVTGVDRTTDWATAAFVGSKREIAFSINFDMQLAGGVKLAPKLSWDHDPTVMTNSNRKPGQSRGQIAESPEAGQDNQTIFVRRIRIKRRSILPGYKMKAAAEPRTLAVGEDEDPGEGLDVPFEMAESPEPEEFVDALTPILDFILEHSEAQVAIAHDQDMPLFKQLIEDQTQNPLHFISVTGNGVGTLRAPGASIEDQVTTESAVAQINAAAEAMNQINLAATWNALNESRHGTSKEDTISRDGYALGQGYRSRTRNDK